MSRMIIVDATEEVACPKCAHAFALSEGISRQAIDRHAEDFDRSLAERASRLEAELAAEAKRRAEREAGQKLTVLKEALDAKERALTQFRTGELELRRQLRELEDARKNQELDYQRRLDEERKRIQDAAHQSAADDFARREAQLRAQIESAQREAADLKRKLEQGSQQLQGEALEVGLEEMLRAAFPMDEIAEVPKGVHGADCLQRVRSASGQLCGTIVWEAKQTKNWSAGWIQKLKDDQQRAGAEIAVLVTAAMPKEAREPFLRIGDVWVTTFAAARPLAEALRVTLAEMHKLRQANLGRSEKMALVYEYICSPRFAQKVKAALETAEAIRADLEAERAAMTRIWKKREAQVQRMTLGLLGVVGDLQGIGEDGVGQLQGIAALPEPSEQES